MSEAELYLLRQRLNAGRLSKVQRGAYVQHLPTGLVRLPDGGVALDPDVQVRQVISRVLTTFAELGTCQKVLRHCKRHGLLLPRHQTSGFHNGELVWKAPSASAIYEIVRNPAYAGAFAYDRRPTDPSGACRGVMRPALCASPWASGSAVGRASTRRTSPGSSIWPTSSSYTTMPSATRPQRP